MSHTCCRTVLKLRVLRSAAGYYIGRACDNCGPHSRESGYFQTEEAAAHALDTREYTAISGPFDHIFPQEA